MGEDGDRGAAFFTGGGGGGEQVGDDPVGAGADVGGGLAVRAAVAPERPAGAVGADVGAGPALVVAVVPFEQVVGELGAIAEAGELAGLAGAGERAAEDAVEVRRRRAAREALALRPRPRRSAGCRCARCGGAFGSTRSRRGGRARRPGAPVPSSPKAASAPALRRPRSRAHARSASPSSGEEACAWRRVGIRPAWRAAQPAATASRIATRHPLRVLGAGDGARQQHRVAAELHRQGGVGGGADPGVEDHRHAGSARR